MQLVILAIGYIFLALADILPKFIEDEDIATATSFVFGIIAMIIFTLTLINFYIE